MSPPRPKLTIVAPMYNEAANVGRTVGLVKDGMAEFPHPWEFVMVNDGSIDDTLAEASKVAEQDERFRVVGYAENKGRGMALRTGFAAARGDVVVSVDFDLSYSIDHVIRIHDALEQNPDWDVVMGSAYMPGGATVGVDSYRLAVSKFGNRILSSAMGGKFKTITCVLRGYRRHALLALDLESTGKEIHLEILSKLVALGFDVREIPATLTARKKGKSKFRFKGTAISHLMFAFAESPMLVFGALGISSSALGILLAAYGSVLSILGTPTVDGPLWSIVVLLVLGGLIFLGFGFVALLIGGLRREVVRLERRVLELRDDAPPPRRN